MRLIILILLIILLIILLAVTIHFVRKSRRCRKKALALICEEEAAKQLNRELKPYGFSYEPSEDYFYSIRYAWQRQFGYSRLYDKAAPHLNMIFDSEPIRFFYRGKEWLLEFWKGQYGIMTGAEIGLYHTKGNPREAFGYPHNTFYESASDEEQIHMCFQLRKKGTVILTEEGRHWWLTGFLLAKRCRPKDLTMEISLEFPNCDMLCAFLKGLKKAGYQEFEYSIHCLTVTLCYTRPHHCRPFFLYRFYLWLKLKLTHFLCRLFCWFTRKLPDTIRKLLYLKCMFPRIYKYVLRCGYLPRLYRTFPKKGD